MNEYVKNMKEYEEICVKYEGIIMKKLRKICRNTPYYTDSWTSKILSHPSLYKLWDCKKFRASPLYRLWDLKNSEGSLGAGFERHEI